VSPACIVLFLVVHWSSVQAIEGILAYKTAVLASEKDILGLLPFETAAAAGNTKTSQLLQGILADCVDDDESEADAVSNLSRPRIGASLNRSPCTRLLASLAR
jgi:hypothetical protein